MPELKDIGGGVKMVDMTGDDVLSTAQKHLGIVDLYNRVQNAPVEAALKQQQSILNQSQIAMIPLETEIKTIERMAKIQDFNLKQNDAVLNTLEKLPTLLNTSPDMANLILQRIGGTSVRNENGTHTIGLQTAGGIKTFTLDPGDVADPKQKAEMAKELRAEWTKVAAPYAIQSQYFGTLKSAAALGSGAGDLGMVFAYMKILDPNSTVREGEQAQVRNLPPMLQQWANTYNRNLGSDAPFLDPTTRQKMVEAAEQYYGASRAGALQQAKFYGNVAANSKLRTTDVIVPIGDITHESVFGPQGGQQLAVPQDGPQPPTTQPATSPGAPPRPGATEAGGLSTQSAPTSPKLRFEANKGGLQSILNSQLFPSGIPKGR